MVVVVVVVPFPSHYLPLPNSGPCNSFYCLGHFKNVYDDDDDDDDDRIVTINCCDVTSSYI